jgi:uncharacterized Zn ribbon protein
VFKSRKASAVDWNDNREIESREKVSDIYGRQLEIGDKFKPIERRLKSLGEHIKQGESFKNYRGYKA